MCDSDTIPVFINFSNHPSDKWGSAQLNAAAAIGKIVDIPFPVIEPLASHADVLELAEQCVCHVLDMACGHDATVHIMGEMTLTYHIVRLLTEHGIPCVASTTERLVTEVDGKKVSEFRFVQFRRY